MPTLVGAADGMEAFAEAWRVWPRKDGKQAAIKAWKKALPKHRVAVAAGEVMEAPVDAVVWSDAAVLRDTVSRFAGAYTRSRSPEFVPYLASWLNGERWSDAMPEGEVVAPVAPVTADEQVW